MIKKHNYYKVGQYWGGTGLNLNKIRDKTTTKYEITKMNTAQTIELKYR